MKRALGVTEFLSKKFIEFDFENSWLAAMGKPEKNFKAIIYVSKRQYIYNQMTKNKDN